MNTELRRFFIAMRGDKAERQETEVGTGYDMQHRLLESDLGCCSYVVCVLTSRLLVKTHAYCGGF